MRRTLVMKFGGSTVGTTTALTQVISIILHEYERWDRLIVVASALEGVTDALIEAAHLAQLSNRRGYRRIVATIRTRHLALVEKLPLSKEERSDLETDIDQLLFDMLDVCQGLSHAPDINSGEKIDQIIGVGERLTTRIIAALLRENDVRGVAVDATDFIVTDNTYGNAKPLLPETCQKVNHYLLPMLDRQIVPVITGFIGATSDGKPTTLGRGGSDYTASILAICMDANEVWMWTDVDGLMSTDPREVDDAHVIPELSYSEVSEMAYFGARILHSRMVKPLRERNIPLWIKNVFKPQQPGTYVANHVNQNGTNRIKAATMIHGVGLYAEQSGPLIGITELVNQTLDEVIGTQADVMITAQSSNHTFMCFVIPTSAGPDALHQMQNALSSRLLGEFQAWQVKPVSILSVIGNGLDILPRLTARVLMALDDIQILALSQGPSHCSLSIVVAPEDADKALRRIHALTSVTPSDQVS
ncbi:MAG: aspartate kinase [Chloroflexi bacterium]|nr:MAG: aspartate kinase [Chloroflexota bacterium]